MRRRPKELRVAVGSHGARRKRCESLPGGRGVRVDGCRSLTLVDRPGQPFFGFRGLHSPAVGSLALHKLELAAFLKHAFSA